MSLSDDGVCVCECEELSHWNWNSLGMYKTTGKVLEGILFYLKQQMHSKTVEDKL